MCWYELSNQIHHLGGDRREVMPPSITVHQTSFQSQSGEPQQLVWHSHGGTCSVLMLKRTFPFYGDRRCWLIRRGPLQRLVREQHMRIPARSVDCQSSLRMLSLTTPACAIDMIFYFDCVQPQAEDMFEQVEISSLEPKSARQSP